ncbi:hypothetical protein N8T08_000437 [Aspergillus melleus]|uniref:Uncharacterized protein n=1 Tax=Aspergillus melleus TaxID=138277 RepID=A0ACC3BBK3_9EURO|nr:hypothetical protein N8T08_000437 [Aspergillus melleus]
MSTAAMSSLTDRTQPALEIRQNSLEATELLSMHIALPQNVTGVPRSCGLLSERELNITERYDATSLVRMLAEGKVTAEELLIAFRKRATIAQQCTNCLTELIPQALEDARACDDYLAGTGKPIGPLHGLPVSVKEQIAIAGRRTNAGFVAWVNNITHDDADIVKSLRKLGAVVFARTNQPQSLMHLETSNNIYGATVNPRNRMLTAGGSTGGEAALMAMHATPLGIGGDIGGSIRVPAALNGIYGFYPTIGRVSGKGAVVPSPGCDSVPGTLGPFARSLRDIELFCKAYSLAEPWIDDVSLIPGDILSPGLGSQLDSTRSLRVGILAHDGVVAPLPPVRTVLDIIKQRLGQAESLDIVPFTPFNHADAWRIITANYFEDGGADIRALMLAGNEPSMPLTDWIINQCQKNMAFVAPTMQGRKVARDLYRQRYNAHWNEAGVDVVLAPVTPSTAPPLGATPYWTYTAVWNLLQYPAIAFPATKFIKDWNTVDLSGETYTPTNEQEASMLRDYSPTAAQGPYEPTGAPIEVETSPIHRANVDMCKLIAYAWDDLLIVNNDQTCASTLATVDSATIFPRLRGALPGEYAAGGSLVGHTDVVARAKSNSVPIYEIPGLGAAIKELETRCKAIYEDWLYRLGLDVVVWPCAGDVGKADADMNEQSAKGAWRNGVLYSNGNCAIRQPGVPTVYDDNNIFRYAYAYEVVSQARQTPRRTPHLSSDIIVFENASVIIGSTAPELSAQGR